MGRLKAVKIGFASRDAPSWLFHRTNEGHLFLDSFGVAGPKATIKEDEPDQSRAVKSDPGLRVRGGTTTNEQGGSFDSRYLLEYV